MQNNNLGSLPPEIGDLKNVQDLYLGNNKISTIPGEIGKLKSLVELKLNNNNSVYVGDYFPLKEFRIVDPRKILNCICRKCDLKSDSMLLLNENRNKWRLYITPIHLNGCGNQQEVHNLISECSEENGLNEAINNGFLKVFTLKESPLDFMSPRSEILKQVRSGKLPKGILKKWPLYLVRTEGRNE